MILKRIRNEGETWQPDSSEMERHKNLWSKYKKRTDFSWLKVYGTISCIKNCDYIPEDVYYTEIEPRLNNKAFSKAYTDKNFYHLILENEILPDILLRSINGTCYDQYYTTIGRITDCKSFLERIKPGKYVIKPTIDSGGGESVRVITVSEDKIDINPALPTGLSYYDLLHYYQRDFLIQYFIEQHHFFSQFNPSSLNTIRILTYRSLEDEKISILHRILRMGKPGSVVDNQASGGIACGIKDNNELAEFGVDKYGRKHYSSNGLTFANTGIVPFLDDVSEIARRTAIKYRYSRLLGMDFGVDLNGKIYLIEINDSNNEINFYQMNNGPMFGAYTEEISRLCIHEPKSFAIDYNL